MPPQDDRHQAREHPEPGNRLDGQQVVQGRQPGCRPRGHEHRERRPHPGHRGTLGLAAGTPLAGVGRLDRYRHSRVTIATIPVAATTTMPTNEQRPDPRRRQRRRGAGWPGRAAPVPVGPDGRHHPDHAAHGGADAAASRRRAPTCRSATRARPVATKARAVRSQASRVRSFASRNRGSVGGIRRSRVSTARPRPERAPLRASPVAS